MAKKTDVDVKENAVSQKEDTKAAKKRSVDEMLEDLEKTVEKLDSEDISLEEAFKLYEKGMGLAKACSKEIDTVEKKVIELAGE